MAANKEAIFVGVIVGKTTELVGVGGTVVFQGDASESTRLDVLALTTDDTADKDVQVYISDGTSDRLAATVKIPLSSGSTNAIPPVNLLAATMMAPHVCTDAAGNKFINLPPGWSIKATMVAAPTSGKKMWIIARGGKY